MILFAINTGLRTNEIFNLAWEDVDIEQKRLKMIVKKNQKPLSLPLERNGFRNHRGAAAQAWPLRVLQPDDRGPVQGREGRSSGGRKAGRTTEGHLAHVPAHLCLPADAQMAWTS